MPLEDPLQKANHLRHRILRRNRDTHMADIPQGGSAFGEYSAVKPLIAFAQELKQLLMHLSQVEDHRPCAWRVEEVNAD